MGVRTLLAAAALALFGLSGARAGEPLTITDFSAGLNTWQSPLLLKEGESPSLQNVVLDERNAVTRRKGYRKLNSTAIGDGSTRVDSVYQLETSAGTRYCVAFSSTAGYWSTDGCQSFTQFVSTLTRNNAVNCDAYSDRLYCVNNQYNFRFDGTNDVTFVGTPASLDYIRVHRNRCFAAGATGTLSRLYYSNLGDCTTWTTATDFIDISAEDGDIITGIGEPIFDVLPIYKKFSTWALKGATPATWVLINVSKNTGAKNHRTIANFNNVQLFDSLGPNGGASGIYGFDGIVVREVSQKLRNEIDLLDTFRANVGQLILDNKSDWDDGTFDLRAMSSARESGYMQSSYTSITETLGTDFGAGTLTFVSTVSIAGAVTMSQGSGTFINAGLETSVSLNWSLGGVSFARTESSNALFSAFTVYGSWAGTGQLDGDAVTCAAQSAEVIFEILNTSDQVIFSVRRGISQGTNNLETINLSTFAVAQVKLKITGTSTEGDADVTQTSIAFLRPDTIYVRYGGNDTATGKCFALFDIDESIPRNLSGDLVSRAYDTAISTPTWGTFSVGFSSTPTGRLSFETQVSTSASGTWDSLVTITDTAKITSAQKRFIRYKASFAVDAVTHTPAQLNNVSFAAASTGTWSSGELTLSLNMTTWGLFQVVETKTGAGAAISYRIQASTYSGGAQYALHVPLTVGSAITSSTGAYAIVTGTWTVTVASEVAKTDSITLNWNEGSQAISATAKVFNGRYHYGAQSNGGTRNDVMYVLDDNGAWTKWTGVRPAFLNVVNQNFVMADSSTSTGGFAFKLYDTDSDDGGAISAFWESKDFALSGIQKIKAVDRMYTVHSSDDSDVTLTLKSDGGLKSKAYTLSFSTGAEFGIKQTVDTSSTAIQGNTFRVRYGNNAASKPWEVLGFILDYRDLGLMRFP